MGKINLAKRVCGKALVITLAHHKMKGGEKSER